MKQEILSEKVVADLSKDFNRALAEGCLEAGQREDFLADPITASDFQKE